MPLPFPAILNAFWVSAALLPTLLQHCHPLLQPCQPGCLGLHQLLHSPAGLLQRRHLLRQGFNLILHRTIAAANLGSVVVTHARVPEVHQGAVLRPQGLGRHPALVMYQGVQQVQ